MSNDTSDSREFAQALEFLEGNRIYARDRAKDLFDIWVKYLVYSNGGGVLVALGLAGAYAGHNVDPLMFGAPVGAFVLGITCAGSAIIVEQDRQDERMSFTGRIIVRLQRGETTPFEGIKEWSRQIDRQAPAGPWTGPRWLALVGAGLFLVGVALGFLVLDRIEPTPTEPSNTPPSVTQTK